MQTFTVFCREADNTGTTYITAVEATDQNAAASAALAECADAWGQEQDTIRVLGIAEGNVTILEWDDNLDGTDFAVASFPDDAVLQHSIDSMSSGADNTSPAALLVAGIPS